MKNALIDPTTYVSYVSSWAAPVPPSPYPAPIFTEIPNSARVAQVADATFDVAPPLFWTDCEDNVVADQWYYDTDTQQIIPVPAPAPYPGTEGTTSGVQSV